MLCYAKHLGEQYIGFTYPQRSAPVGITKGPQVRLNKMLCISQPSHKTKKKKTACVTVICLVTCRPACVSAVLILCLSICFAILVDLFYPYRCLCCSISYINLKSSNFK